MTLNIFYRLKDIIDGEIYRRYFQANFKIQVRKFNERTLLNNKIN